MSTSETKDYLVKVRVNEATLRAWQHPNRKDEETLLNLVRRAAMHTFQPEESEALQVLSVHEDKSDLCFDYSAEAIRAHFEGDTDEEIQIMLALVTNEQLDEAAANVVIENDLHYQFFCSGCRDALVEAARQAEDEEVSALELKAKFIVAEWSHIFASDAERQVRWVYDREAKTVPFVQLHIRGGWSKATEEERLDVADSVLQHDPETLYQNEYYECSLAVDLPEWAVVT